MTNHDDKKLSDADDDEFQASSEDIDIKPWDLPFWKGGPKKSKSAHEAQNQHEDVEVVTPLTVEDIEKIRSEAYEEGFLQGLNEGRDKGEAEGRASGLEAGKKEGLELGKEEGRGIGFKAGEEEGLASGKQEIADAAVQLANLSKQLEQSLVEKDSAIPQVLSQLIQSACASILERELEQGDDQITQKVIRALDELPAGADNIKIYISPLDAMYLNRGLVTASREINFAEDESLATGSARITTKQSLLEFSHKERMDKIFEVIEQECEKLDVSSEYIEAEEAEEAEEVSEEKESQLEAEPEPEPEPEQELSNDPETDQEDVL